MLDIQNLFSNILFVILPYLLTEIFFQGKPRIAKLSFFILSLISIVLCMNYPIIHTDIIRYDLRFILFLFAMLYGGWRMGVSLLAFFIGYRFYLSGIGAFVSLVSYSMIVVALIPLRSYYFSLCLRKKILFTIGFSLLHSVLIIATYFSFSIFSLQFIWRLIIHMTVTGFVTILLEKYQENQLMHASIHKSDKLTAISEIAASVSHEIRNPMTVVRGFIQLILQDKIPEKHATYLTLSMTELDRAEKIINDYLAFARPQTDRCEIIQLERELEHVASILTPYATLHGVEITLEKDTNVNIWGDSQKLRQALINLVKNGIEAMPEGGTLKLNLDRKKDYGSILIKDTGMGMTKDQIHRLGTPYYSLKEKGTGLGTMVSFRVIERMQGIIEIQSEIGRGTQFTISFPIYQEESYSNFT